MKDAPNRRAALKTFASGAALAAAGGLSAPLMADIPSQGPLKGNIKHSTCKWCYKNQSLDELAAAAKRIGMSALELLDVEDYPTLKKYDLVCAITWGVPGGIKSGLNRIENHDAIYDYFARTIPLAQAGGSPQIICFSGNRDGMDDEQGLENCSIGLKRIMPLAEKSGITVTMELLNSKVNHPDYMCDRTHWGVALCDKVGSERFKLLYDIYHMQIMEGDIIATIRKHHPYISHYHTGGVPGRHEIDETQELHYPAIMQAIVDTGFKGYVAQEFVPAGPDPLASLEQGVRICDV